MITVKMMTNGELINLLEDINDELKVRLTVGRVEQAIAPTLSERERVIYKSKKALEDLKNPVGHYVIRYLSCNVEFIVNKEKRTVVAILRCYQTKRIQSKGLSKCDPSDVFNSHIGKAIALYRALGIPVPKEILESPQPTEKQIGDIVEYNGKQRRMISEKEKFTIGETAHIRSVFGQGGKLIDDSKE